MEIEEIREYAAECCGRPDSSKHCDSWGCSTVLELCAEVERLRDKDEAWQCYEADFEAGRDRALEQSLIDERDAAIQRAENWEVTANVFLGAKDYWQQRAEQAIADMNEAQRIADDAIEAAQALARQAIQRAEALELRAEVLQGQLKEHLRAWQEAEQRAEQAEAALQRKTAFADSAVRVAGAWEAKAYRLEEQLAAAQAVVEAAKRWAENFPHNRDFGINEALTAYEATLPPAQPCQCGCHQTVEDGTHGSCYCCEKGRGWSERPEQLAGEQQ